jgi:hypothetical protein
MCWGSRHQEKQSEGHTIAGQCTEVEEFQKWQASPDLDLERAEQDWFPTQPDLLTVNSIGKAERTSSYSTKNLITKNRTLQVPTRAGLKLQSKSMEQKETAPSMMAPSHSANERTQVTTEALASGPSMDSDHWASDLLSLQESMDVEMHRLAELHKAHMEHHKQKDMQIGEQDTAKPDLLVKIEDLQREMCSDSRRQSHPSCVSFFSSHPVQHHKNSSEWIASVEQATAPVKSKLEDTAKEPLKDTIFKARNMTRKKSKSASIMEDLQKKMHDLDEGLEKIHHKHEVWERSMASRAMALRVQMCAESHHKHNKACENLWHEVQSQPISEGTEKEDDEIQISEEAAAVAADPLHLLHLPTLAPPERTGSRFMKQRIVAQRQVLKATDLRSKHWGGKIPKVACIMAIPEQNATGADLQRKSAVERAVDAFRSESYEGPKQLVMVYQYKDQQAAKLAKQIADGTYIKAVGAHMGVPSTMSLRFGAWESDADADVVARWDIDAFHHPERLSMQVRALGYSGRPASLNMWGVNLKQDGTRSVIGEPFGLENSMVGLRLYMERNWRPFAGDDAPDHLAKVGDLVHLDMPELTRK